MTGLDITKVRDYATFMALTANNQGWGGDEAVKAFLTKVGGNSSEPIRGSLRVRPALAYFVAKKAMIK